ncbi:MAG: hypothetical protein KIT20_03140 [Alphaproteobacteria bacterium]|nr:hypothetical protein [Alphaproteobacteria bacterium]
MGELEVWRDRERLELPPSRKTRALLAYLLLAPRPPRREQLCAFLWDVPDDPRGALRWSLSKLRPLLDEPGRKRLVSAGETVGILTMDMEVDLLSARRLAASGLESAETDALERAARLFRGEFLEDVDLPACPDFQSWRAAEREEARGLEARILTELVGRLSGNPVEALPFARQLARAAPYDAVGHVELIRLLNATGRHAEALTQYEISCRLLDELGEGGSAEVRAAWMQGTGRRSDQQAAPPPAAAPLAPPPAEPIDFLVPPTPRVPEGRPSIVVLPFENLSGDPGKDYLADGIVEEITSALSRVHDFFVIARMSANAFRDSRPDVRMVAEQLGVRYVLEGSVRIAEPRLRIAAQLVDAEDRRCLWAETHEGVLTDMFEFQDELARKVVGALSPSIRAAEIAKARRKRPENLRSYDLVLRAYPHLWAHRKQDNLVAIDLLEQAMAADPGYCLAAALAAWSHAQQIVYLWSDDEAADARRGRECVAQAELLVEDDPTALVAIGAAITLLHGDLEVALGYVERALALDPNHAWGWMRSGFLHAYRGDHEVAIEHFRLAMRLSPMDPFRFNSFIGMATSYFTAGRYTEAADWVRKAMRERPGMTWAYRFCATSLAMAGDVPRAREAIEALLRERPDLTVSKVAAALPSLPEDMLRNYLHGLRLAGLPE